MIVYVGIPMYGGAHGLVVRSLLSMQSYLISKGHEVVFDIVVGGSILPKVRNGIVKRFIDGGADVLLFIDSDMVFDPESIEKLINAPFDVSVCNYRKKNNEVTWLAEPVKDLDGCCLGKEMDGISWLKTTRAGTGVMAIKRQTIDVMTDNYPDLWYMDGGEKIPCLFDFNLDDGHYYGEDYTFCKRLDDTGGTICMLPDAFIGHVGETVYGGNYHDYLRG